jgi:toxin secretion/phage lysis holin
MTAPERATEIKAAVAAIIAFLTSLWGWVGWAVWIWIACMAIDYISGSAAAKKDGTWASSVARAGLWHKLGEVFAVLVAALCDIALHVLVNGAGVQIGVELPAMVTPVVLLWYILTELGSIAENAGKLGAPVPKWLQKSLAAYKDKIDEDHEEPSENAAEENA